MKSRKSGILLHITSLPSDFGIGDMGKGGYLFADFLHKCGQSIWQVLPFSPASVACGSSPYCSYSAFAGNPLMIGLDLLVQDGFISWNDLSKAPAFNPARTDFEEVAEFKTKILQIAYNKFIDMPEYQFRFEDFLKANAYWLNDYALFMALKDHFGGTGWNEWPREIRDRTEPALKEWSQKLAARIGREQFYQFLFFRQWTVLKSYCNRKNIQVIGDIPIYVSYDSSDVWANSELFKLDGEKSPLLVAGVPPDYFSSTGQLWGNPVYNWGRLKETSFAWWINRLEHNLTYFDIVRLDHFRGFVSYWEVPASETTAINGKWAETPVRDFFNTLLLRFPSLHIIAEDLGIITPDVKEIMQTYGFPGMKVLLFAFGDDAANPYIPHNHIENCVVYTGTHDNNTVKGWYRQDATETEKQNLEKYLGREINESNVSWELIRFALMSVASTAIIPMQDFLGLGSEARMNTPSTIFGNWSWRVTTNQLTPALAEKVAGMTTLYGRA
jgi:4-alpha-glucanotransferase